MEGRQRLGQCVQVLSIARVVDIDVSRVVIGAMRIHGNGADQEEADVVGSQGRHKRNELSLELLHPTSPFGCHPGEHSSQALRRLQAQVLAQQRDVYPILVLLTEAVGIGLEPLPLFLGHPQAVFRLDGSHPAYPRNP